MIRSMYSAISGLRNHQTMMDVVGNNIANVNTTGFKGSTTVFNDVLYQTLLGGNGPGQMGGTNPAQVGLGSTLASVSTNFAQGALQRSGRNTDLAIQGDGFFVVNQGGERIYTRSGSFSLDANGDVVSSEGGWVQGWMADPATGAVNSNGPIENLNIPVGALITPQPTGTVTVTGNLPATSALATTLSTSINAYDSRGVAVPINFTFSRTQIGNPAATPPTNDQWTVGATYGATGTALTLTNNVLSFDTGGELVAGGALTINANQIPNLAGAITVNLGDGNTPVSQYGSSGTILARDQNGAAPGALQSFIMGRDGIITGTYSNGKTQTIGQVAMANFANPQGLEKIGASMFRVTPNAGAPEIGTPGSGGRGVLVQGATEQSNVDLAQEFTSMILAQRGFQANSRVITASDEMLQEVVNLKR